MCRTGQYLAVRLLEAADRGVKVRLLVDDLDARDHNYGYAALDAHSNISVRMFNPFKSRAGSVSFMFEAMGSFSRINRRMHNKSWIADNRIAIVGGRNRVTSTSVRATRSTSSTSILRWWDRSCATRRHHSTATGIHRLPIR
jgi:phosphatidylserine/phosphatidylglycerophosphate/cardiolipin synthase-like enzyme